MSIYRRDRIQAAASRIALLPPPPSGVMTHNTRITGSTPAPAAWTVSNGTELYNAINSAAPGTVIVARGNGVDYANGTGKFTLPAKNFAANPITIRPADYSDKPIMKIVMSGASTPITFNNCGGIIWDGWQWDLTDPGGWCVAWQGGVWGQTFKRSYIRNAGALRESSNGRFISAYGGGGGISFIDCVVDNLGCLLAANGGSDFAATGNSFLRMREHALKVVADVKNFIVDGNLFDTFKPGWKGVEGDPYIEHANALYVGGWDVSDPAWNASQRNSNIQFVNNLFISETDHSRAGCVRVEPKDTPTDSVIINNNIVLGGIYYPIAWAGCGGSGHQTLGNALYRLPSPLGEITAHQGIRFESSTVQIGTANTFPPILDGAGNILTATGTPNGYSTAYLSDLAGARAYFGALALASNMRTLAQLGL